MPRFRLERLLDLRKRRELALQQRVALAVAARLRAQAELNRLEADEQMRREQLGLLLTADRMQPGEVRELGQLLELRTRTIGMQNDELARCLAFEAQERTRLIEATVARQALDKLRERHVEQERLAENRREAIVMEEIANARSARTHLAVAVAGGDA
jgi:flagellar export protein FliJ